MRGGRQQVDETLRISRGKFIVLTVMSVAGMVASSIVLYLYEILHTSLPVCESSQLLFGVIRIDCNAVLSSPYNNVYGINLDLLAVVYFAVSIVLVCTYAFARDRASSAAFKTLFGWRFLGLLIVPYLMFVEFGILQTICVYCTIMHVAILADFVVISYFLFFQAPKDSAPVGPEENVPVPNLQ